MVYIVTGPTHCGKTTYINKYKNENDITIDQFVYQDEKRTLTELTEAYYEFLKAIEFALIQRVYNDDYNIWIEGCFSNPYRIAQIINTIYAVEPHEEVEVIYIIRDDEWYDKYCEDKEIAQYAKHQSDFYECYQPNLANQPTIYFIVNDLKTSVEIKGE